MTTIANTKENNAKVKALKNVGETKWVGNTIHDTMNKCLTAINLDSFNSGFYTPVAVRINGVTGWFMLNQDGSIFCEARVIKEDENRYKIEYMTNVAWNEFENSYCQFRDYDCDHKVREANGLVYGFRNVCELCGKNMTVN